MNGPRAVPCGHGADGPGEVRRAWARRLRAASEPVLARLGAVDPATFRDETGARRPVDPVFVAWAVRDRGGDPPSVEGAKAAAGPEALEVRWWRAVSSPGEPVVPDLPVARGPIPGINPGVVETFTEAHLACVHAAVWLGLHRRDERWLAGAARVVEWLIDEVQPDNATNRPWGVHAFVLLSGRLPEHARRAADAYAQTLLHNCQVYVGRPDVVSALILHDAAEAIEKWERAGF